MVSFSFLDILKIAKDLKFLSSEFIVWTSSGTVYIIAFSVYRPYFYVFICLILFLLKTGHLKWYNVAILEIRSSLQSFLLFLLAFIVVGVCLVIFLK